MEIGGLLASIFKLTAGDWKEFKVCWVNRGFTWEYKGETALNFIDRMIKSPRRRNSSINKTYCGSDLLNLFSIPFEEVPIKLGSDFGNKNENDLRDLVLGFRLERGI